MLLIAIRRSPQKVYGVTINLRMPLSYQAYTRVGQQSAGVIQEFTSVFDEDMLAKQSQYRKSS
jgi:hypothetical protein